MRILTVRQPWAWAIIHGGKDVENRVRNIAGDYRGPVAIHVGLGYAADAPEKLRLDHARWTENHYRARGQLGINTELGVIIGVVDLVDVHTVANAHFHPICYDHRKPDGLRDAAAGGTGACSPWTTADARWHLVLANPRPLAEPIPFRGALGLRRLDDDTVARIEATIA